MLSKIHVKYILYAVTIEMLNDDDYMMMINMNVLPYCAMPYCLKSPKHAQKIHCIVFVVFGVGYSMLHDICMNLLCYAALFCC